MTRARDLGVVVGRGTPGPRNAITDVTGVRVGHATLIEGEGPLHVGRGPVRTGVTVILPRPADPGAEPVFAGCHRLNGNGELTGLEWVRESGMLMTPVAITNTHSVGVVRDALIAARVRSGALDEDVWSLPVVGETWDGRLNDINGQHVRAGHVDQALASATDGAVPEGNVGGGTGMICHGFKGGIGTASRTVPSGAGAYTVGVLVQANYGRRERFRVNGLPVGEVLDARAIPLPGPSGAPAPSGRPPSASTRSGSIIVIVATDAPLLPHQCTRLAQRAGLGVARMGGVGEHSSGDLFLAFATGNGGLPGEAGLGEAGAPVIPIRMLADAHITPLFDAVIESTEEAILNALVAAETMVGRDGITAHRLDHHRFVDTLDRLGRDSGPTRPEYP
ncbi:MAG TPA: P1 family peptidase [Candidatus Limnocylindrales bacterium]|nr:P1 family peptidase [Candidatus Limnocylindrales bacterium]